MEELKSHKSEWKAERKAIVNQYESRELVEQLEKRQEKRHARRKNHKAPKEQQPQKGHKAAHFLLWDGQPKALEGTGR